MEQGTAIIQIGLAIGYVKNVQNITTRSRPLVVPSNLSHAKRKVRENYLYLAISMGNLAQQGHV